MSKTCSNCGYEINDEVKFCPNCGTEVLSESEIKIGKICPKCGEHCEEEALYCPSCGTYLIPKKKIDPFLARANRGITFGILGVCFSTLSISLIFDVDYIFTIAGFVFSIFGLIFGSKSINRYKSKAIPAIIMSSLSIVTTILTLIFSFI